MHRHFVTSHNITCAASDERSISLRKRGRLCLPVCILICAERISPSTPPRRQISLWEHGSYSLRCGTIINLINDTGYHNAWRLELLNPDVKFIVVCFLSFVFCLKRWKRYLKCLFLPTIRTGVRPALLRASDPNC